VRLCLDTHAFLWLIAMPARLGASLATLRDEAHELLVSAVVPWEIAVKSSLGKLKVPQPVVSTIPGLIRDIGARALSIEHADALAVAELPPLHRDPFDRLLVAQARRLGLTVVTADPQITQYDVDVLRVPTA